VAVVDKANPYALRGTEVPADCGLRCRMTRGVVLVYPGDDDPAAAAAVPPTTAAQSSAYPRLSEFLADQALLTRLVSDGPL